MSHRFRFGVSAGRARSRADWIALAKRIDSLGYDTLLMADHFGPRFAIAPALVLAAQAVPTLRVASLVYDNDFRHPALLAQEIATIDILTDGRFDFGIGAGWLKQEYDAAGLPFDRGRLRVDRLEEALAVIADLLTGKPVTYAGTHYTFNALASVARPVQQPSPPLLLGGGGRRLLSLAAERADIISVMPRARRDGSGLEDADASENAFAEKIEWIRERAGERFERIVLNTLVQTVTITDDPNAEAQRLVSDWRLPATELLASPLLLIGSVERIAQTLVERRDRLGISYITVFEKDLEALAPVIERLRTIP